jgi:catechol 2,3-dioxygenase-like lactoylglutathione lyase family enzyme
MPLVTGLLHVAIKTNDLDRTLRFWRDVIGLVEAPRPAFGYPGAWLAVPTPVGESLIHVYAGGPAMGADGRAPAGTAAIDHVSLTAQGYGEFRARFLAHGLPFREFVVPGTTLWQLFVFDPSGVQLELTFDARAETGAEPDLSPGRKYEAGVSFFDPEAFAAL